MNKKFSLFIGLMFALCSQVLAQSRQISGVVNDATGSGLPGVSITVKGSGIGTVTDADGSYTISNVNDNSILVFSYIGFTTQEVAVGANNTVDVSLTEDATVISEIVVTGYGTQKKSQTTGAIASISNKEISELPVTNLAQALTGRASGVNVTQSGSKPGSTPKILIRGRRSFNAGNDPLYVVDGIPLSAGYEDINPNDIQSMEVLKDATATAIYGARGANGVILVSTKRGSSKKGKTTVTIDSYAGQSDALDKIELFEGAEFAEYVREAYRATNLYKDAAGNPVPTGVADAAADAKVAVLGGDPNVAAGLLANRNNNYQDLVLHSGFMQNHTIGVQGGNDKTDFYISAGLFQDKGVTDLLDYTRTSLRANIDHTVNQRFKVGISSYMMYSDRNGENLNPYASTLNQNPLGRPYDDNGNLIFQPTNDALLYNPLFDLVPGAQIDNTKKYRIFNSLYGEVKILDGLKYRVNFGPDFTLSRWGRFAGAFTTTRAGGSTFAANENRFGFDWTLENIVSYEKTFGKHHFTFTGLQSIQRDKFELYRSEVIGVPAETQQFYNLGSAAQVQSINSNLIEWTINSFMGRINYDFNDKYLLTLTLRRDGSSRFGENTKYGNFPGIAVGWNLGNEKFFSGIKGLDLLKLRAGWGEVGNQGVAPYQTQGLLGRTTYAFGTNAAYGYRPNTIGNPDLRWESSATANIGLDFSVFAGRVQGSIDVYQTDTKSLLLSDFLPGSTGFNAVTRNVGHTRNKGIELNISTININANKFRWSTDLSFTKNTEAIVELYNGKVDDLGNRWFIGEPLNTFFDYKKLGIWQSNEADAAKSFGSEVGQIKIQDTNGDGKINASDRVKLGSDIPDFQAGLTNRFSYKGIDLNFFFYASIGQMIVSGFHQNNNALAGRYQQIKVDYWTPNNPTNEFPRPKSTQEFPVNNTALIYFDGSFIKLRNVNLGYTVPASFAKKMKAESVRLYASVQQPFIWSEFRSKYNGVDPEATITSSATGITAVNSGITPATRIVTFGFNLKF
ncbi:MAG: TonB-dependent receptor [Saprospiraceae bacterium]|nr:TonB-dependent receptor [Saprospiraceae bacterium]